MHTSVKNARTHRNTEQARRHANNGRHLLRVLNPVIGHIPNLNKADHDAQRAANHAAHIEAIGCVIAFMVNPV